MENSISRSEEIALDELSQVAGGAPAYGGFKKRPDEMNGYRIYKIAPGDRLGDIARRFGTTVAKIQKVNPSITDPDRIMAGYFIYIP